MEKQPKYLFHCENGKTYAVCRDMCLVCKRLESLVYDYTNGPYMFFCKDGMENEEHYCNSFEFMGENDKVKIYKGE